MSSASVSSLDVAAKSGRMEVEGAVGRGIGPAPRPSSPALLQMWAGLVRCGWRSLAIVPASPEVTARDVAHGLSELARMRGVGPVSFVDATGISAADGPRVARELSSRSEAAGRAVVLVDAPVLHLGGIPVILSVDAVLLVLPLGRIDPAALRNTVDIVGRQRVLGHVALQSGHDAA